MRADDEDRGTREAFDAVATDDARMLPDLAIEAPLDRALLAAFVEMVGSSGGVVADIGCGTARVTAHLVDAGLKVVGLDLSLGTVCEARPDLALAVAHAGTLPLRSAALSGLVTWYSLIHLRTDRLPGVFADFARVTRSGAPVVVGFQSGDGERVDRTTAYGHDVPLTYYRHRVEDVVDALVEAGFEMHATVRREPAQTRETTPQAFLLARRA